MNGAIDEATLEAMSIAVMALFLRNEKRTLERLSIILQKLEIYADNDYVLNIQLLCLHHNCLLLCGKDYVYTTLY